MKYGSNLDINVQDSTWLCQIGIRGPYGYFASTVYARGNKLEDVLKDLLMHAREEYVRVIEREKQGKQLDLDLE